MSIRNQAVQNVPKREEGGFNIDKKKQLSQSAYLDKGDSTSPIKNPKKLYLGRKK